MQFENICPFVRYAVKTTYLPNRHMVKARDCRLFYTIRGEGTFVTPDKAYPLKPGSLVLYPAGHAYMPLPEKEGRLLFFTLNFDYNTHYARFENVMPPCKATLFDERDVLPSHLDTGIDLLARFLHIAEAGYLQDDLEELARCFALKELYWRDSASAILKKILISILQRQTVVVSGRKTAGRVVDYLHEHYAEPITNDNLAKVFGYHPYHLERLFKSFTGKTLHTYLLELRLEKALEYLMNANLPIGEVAAKSGFMNAEHFSTAFRKKYGQPPSRFSVLKSSERGS